MNPLSCLSRDTGSIKNTGKRLVGFADEFGNGKIMINYVKRRVNGMEDSYRVSGRRSPGLPNRLGKGGS